MPSRTDARCPVSSSCHHPFKVIYTLHTSRCRCVGCSRSPESLTCVSSSGLSRLPPSCALNYFGYPFVIY
ncbi:hypothetical protein PZBJ_14755 [Pantoea endophytica]|uniref:Uncharacterized protein n=1 Tax=Pantoea endophytica TaxID=92488 RepID=A0ABX4SP61_9GAMM|nr:hypothetical protein PZBJ_14755 [Pantoea endophytica]